MMTAKVYALYFYLFICLLQSAVLPCISANFNKNERITVQCDSALWYGSLFIAKSEIGVREVGNNAGPRVEQYLRAVGLGKGYPYCMAGQYFCFAEYNKLNKTTFVIPLLRSGSTVAVYNHAKKIVGKDIPQIGDLIFWKYSGKPLGHVERIISIGRNGWIETVGFNTGSNARDGDGVERKKRNIMYPLQKMFLRGCIGRKNAI